MIAGLHRHPIQCPLHASRLSSSSLYIFSSFHRLLINRADMDRSEDTETSLMALPDLLGLPLPTRREIALQLLWSLPRDEMRELTERLSSMMQKDIVGFHSLSEASQLLTEQNLPPELATQILVNLDSEDLLNCSLVSQAWARACNDQGLWALRCASTEPAIKPSSPAWSDITLHRQLMSVRPFSSIPDEMNPEIMEDPSFDIDDRDLPGVHPAPAPNAFAGSPGNVIVGADAIGSTLGRGRFAGVRQSVWERTGLASLPIFTSSPVKQSAPKEDPLLAASIHPPILSHLPLPSPHPQANYKHLYLVHRLMARRRRSELDSPAVKPSPSIVDAISSIESGGLPGHSEAIYALALVRHPMKFTINTINTSCADCSTTSTLFNEEPPLVPGTRPRAVVVSGRDWLLSGSRDKTLRLWQLDCPKPRVVKVFVGAHDASVLSLFASKVKTTSSPPTQANSPAKGSPIKSFLDRRKEKMVAVSGGSDGKICLWDLEGDGTAEKVVQAHSDSVLCVKGDAERIVSCSKDRTIKVFDINTLETLLVVGERDAGRHRGAINAVNLSKDYVISASGDRSIKVWCIHTGDLLTTVDSAHPRGIASLDFAPAPPMSQFSGPDGRIMMGTIASGSSDASVRLFTLTSVASDFQEMPLVAPMQDLTFQEMLDTDDVVMASSAQPLRPPVTDISATPGGISGSDRFGTTMLRAEEGPTCWTECICPPGLSKPNASQCMRCWNRGHTNLVRTVCLQDDVVITGSYDATVKVWDRETGQLLNDLTGARTGRVFAVAGDRTRVVSTGLDCRINIWNFAQGLDTSFVEP